MFGCHCRFLKNMSIKHYFQKKNTKRMKFQMYLSAPVSIPLSAGAGCRFEAPARTRKCRVLVLSADAGHLLIRPRPSIFWSWPEIEHGTQHLLAMEPKQTRLSPGRNLILFALYSKTKNARRNIQHNRKHSKH